MPKDKELPWYGDLSSLIEDTRHAAAFLVRIPTIATSSPGTKSSGAKSSGAKSPEFSGRMGQSMRAFPFVGVGIGIIGAIIFHLLSALHLPPAAAAIGTLASWIILTGALHEDGLADSCDALSAAPSGGVAQQRQKRIAILHAAAPIGAGGAWALIGIVTAQVALLDDLGRNDAGYPAGMALIAAATLSRAAMVAFAASLPVLKTSTLARKGGSPNLGQATFAVLVASIVALVTLGFGGAVQAFLLVSAATAGWVALCRNHFGGYNGDLCGALQQGVQTIVIASAVMST